jgi:hypothetical protein
MEAAMRYEIGNGQPFSPIQHFTTFICRIKKDRSEKMSETKFTNGPWKVTPGHAAGAFTVRQDGGEFQRPVAEIWHNGDDPETNARLISQAPSMFEALQQELDALYMDMRWAHDTELKRLNTRVERIEAVLAKATGEA